MNIKKMSSNMSLEDRERIFAERVNSAGIYTYVSGYTKSTAKVKAIHNNCGNLIEVSGNMLLRGSKNYCHKCEPTIRFMTDIKDVQKEVDKLEMNNHYTVIEKYSDYHSGLKVECNVCKNKYKTTFSNIKKNQFKCCSQNSTPLFDRHVRQFSHDLLKKMKNIGNYYLGSQLLDFIKKEADKKKYIETGFIEKDKFVHKVHDYLIGKLYEEKYVGHCNICCNSLRGKSKWGGEDNFEARVCKECASEEYYCHECKEYYILDEFYYNYELKEYETVCKSCKGALIDDELINSLFE